MRESRKPNSRLIAIIVSIALLCAMMPLSALGTDKQPSGYDYAKELGVELGNKLYDHNFSELDAVPDDWSVASGSAAMGSAEQGGITKKGYSISGANGSLNTVRIGIPAENYVAKLTMYQVTGYWGGDNGRVYLCEQGLSAGSEAYFETAQIQLGGYKRSAWAPPKNGAVMYKYNEDGTINTNKYTHLEDIGGGFGADGNSALTVYFYSVDGTNYLVSENGTLLASAEDAKAFEENYITIAGDYMRILLSDFEAYELKTPAPDNNVEYDYVETLGVELGKNIYDHNFSETNTVPSDWSVVSGSAAMGTLEQGGVKKVGYSISGSNGNMNTVRIPITAKNYVVKVTMYQDSTYWAGTNGRMYIYKQGRVSGNDTYFENAQIQLGGYSRTSWLPPANGAAIYKYDSNGTTSNDTAIRLENIGGGFGTDGNSAYTIFIYSLDGMNYYVNEAGELLGAVKDAKQADENYFAIAGDYMRVLISDFEVYELGSAAEEVYTNLVLNGNFDTDTSYWIPCTQGVTLEYNSEGYATATVKKTGYCELYSNVFEIKENYDLVFEFDYKSGKTYDSDVFSAYLFLYTAESMAGKDKTTLGANGTIPSGYKSAHQMLIPKTAWQNGKIEMTVPAGYSYGQIRFGFRGSVPVGDSFSVDNVKVYRLMDVYDRINEAIEAEDAEAFKTLIKEKSANVKHELISVDAELMSALKALKTEKGEDLTVNDIYAVAMNYVTDIGDRLELFVEDSLIDLNGTTASFVAMTPKFEEQTINLSGGFRCEDANGDKYNGQFDISNLTEDTRPWEHLGGDYCQILKDGDVYRMYYRGADDGILTANAYTGAGGDDPLTYYMNICYAESKDGINWYRPELGLHEFIMNGESLPNNIMIGDVSENFDGSRISSFSVTIDTRADCPADQRYKGLLVNVKAQGWGYSVYALKSADGIHWSKMNGGRPVINDNVGESFDSHNVCVYSEESDEFVLYFRRWANDPEYGRQRIVSMLTSKDFVNWQNLDDAVNLDYYSNESNDDLAIKNENYDGDHPDNYQLYTNGIQIYDRAPHYFIGTPTRYLGDSTGHEVAPYLIASRDGVTFKFWDNKLIENSAELDRDGNRSNYAICGIVQTGEKEYSIYASRGFKDSVCIIDRFSFRTDGFVAAVGDSEGKTVVTTPITFDGNRLLINYKANGGTVRAQLTDLDGNVIEGFGFDDCTALTGDSIEQEICFSGDLSKINQPVKVCFELTNAELYSYRFAEEVFDAGDVNKDGEIDVCDLVALNNMITDGTAEATPVNDLNGDGKADKLDLAEIRKLIIS